MQSLGGDLMKSDPLCWKKSLILSPGPGYAILDADPAFLQLRYKELPSYKEDDLIFKQL